MTLLALADQCLALLLVTIGIMAFAHSVQQDPSVQIPLSKTLFPVQVELTLQLQACQLVSHAQAATCAQVVQLSLHARLDSIVLPTHHLAPIALKATTVLPLLLIQCSVQRDSVLHQAKKYVTHLQTGATRPRV
jgi:hypothetical protein